MFAVFCLAVNLAFAQSESQINLEGAQTNLPALMSLGQAFNLASPEHPDLLQQAARVQAQKVGLSDAEQANQWQANLKVSAISADLNNDDDSFKDDSRVEISIRKSLWDFGRSTGQIKAAALGVESANIGSEYAQRLHRIDIMQRFFAVISADYQFAADNETMSLAFFPFNRAQDRRERFDNVSELEVMEKRVPYFEKLTLRNQTLQKQRRTRFQLALAMGLPHAQPEDLLMPDLSAYERELPDFDALIIKVLAANPLLKQKQAELAKLDALQTLATKGEGPNLSFSLDAGAYEQAHRTRDKARAVLVLDIPLLSGKKRATSEAKIAAQQSAKLAELRALDFKVRQQVLDWVQRLESLNQSIEQSTQNLEYRERALDKSRLLYEMDVRAQIGQAMADMAKVIWQDAQAKFERALVWAQIDAVLGAPIVEFE